MSGRDNIHPELLKLIDRSELEPWFFTDKLKKGDVLGIRTEGSVYRFELVDIDKRRFKMTRTESSHLPCGEEVNAYIGGTTLTGTGTMLKMRGITTGMRLVIFIENEGELILSPTREVKLNGYTILPAENN